MKRILFATILLLLSTGALNAQDYTVDFATVAAQKHPRLLIDNNDMKTVRKLLMSNSNKALSLISRSLQNMAEDRMNLENSSLTFVADGVKNPLSQARNFMKYAIAAGYSYRLTMDKTFVYVFEPIIDHYCDNFDEWMNNTPIDAFIIHAEYAIGLAFAYDWMYDVLRPKMRERMEQQMKAHMLECKWNESAGNNRSQVCNACYMACAIALADKLDAGAMPGKMKIRIEDLRKTMSMMYDKDGATNESASYWCYGSDFQAIALAVLEKSFGTDFGLANTSGFRNTLKYRNFTCGNVGFHFDFGDCSKNIGSAPCVFYYAWKFNNPNAAFAEYRYLKDKGYRYDRTAIIALVGAMGLGKNFDPVQSQDKFYTAVEGLVPMVIARTGYEKTDAYAGIKGGSPLGSHGHMDIGTFTYEAFGQRWASDYYIYAYQRHRNILKKLGGTRDRKDIEYPGWTFFHVNNRQHNTLTVNGRNQVPQGKGFIVDTLNTGHEWGATIDLSACYALDLTKAVRSITLHEDQSLDIKDCVTVNDKGEAKIRWTLCTLAKPEMSDEGVVLTSGGVKMLLKTDAPGAEYKTWPNDPGAYGNPVGDIEAKEKLVHSEFKFVGYEFTLPAGASADVMTTFRKL